MKKFAILILITIIVTWVFIYVFKKNNSDNVINKWVEKWEISIGSWTNSPPIHQTWARN